MHVCSRWKILEGGNRGRLDEWGELCLGRRGRRRGRGGSGSVKRIRRVDFTSRG